MKPFAIKLPNGTMEDFDNDGLDRFQKSLFAQFHDAYDKLPPNDQMSYFANLFTDFQMKPGKKRSIWVEWMWNRKEPAVLHCVGYKDFEDGKMPDNILDRINFLKSNDSGMELRYRVWDEK